MSAVTSQYQHSGAIGSSLIVVPLTGAAASLLLGLAYAYVTVYSPIGGWISILFVLGYAFAVGIATVMAVRGSKCRNTAVAGLLAGLVSLAALYSAWVYFLFVLLRRGNMPLLWTDLPTLFTSPVLLWNMLQAVNQNGWFEMFGGPVTGGMLWVFWLVEAAIIVGMITIFGMNAISDEVFCERCRAWTDTGEMLRLAVPEKLEELQSLAAGNLEGLYALEPVPLLEYPRMQVETKQCSVCRNMVTCKVKAMSQETDKQGNHVEKAKDLTGHLIISRDEYERMLDLAKRPVAIDQSDEEVAEEDGAELQ